MNIDRRGLGIGNLDGAQSGVGHKGEQKAINEDGKSLKGDFVEREGARRAREGVIVSIEPDFCRVGDAVVPFTIKAYLSDAINTAKTAHMTGRPVVHRATIIPRCYGAEASDGGGIYSGTVNGACWPLTWSEKVFCEGEPVVRDGDLWAMNNGNTIGRLIFPAPPLPEDEDREGKALVGKAEDEDEAKAGEQAQKEGLYVDIEPPDGLAREQQSQYDFAIDEPLREGAVYARSAPVARPAPRRGIPPPPPFPRRVLRQPDQNRDPQGYWRYWNDIPSRSESGLAYRPYPRRYWPDMLGDSMENSFRNPFLGRPQETGMPRPWSNVIARPDGRFDFGRGRVITEGEFERLFFSYLHYNRERWINYNHDLQTALQERNPDLGLTFLLSEDIEETGETGLPVNRPSQHVQLPHTVQSIVDSLTHVGGDGNVRVTGRYRYCKVLPLCFSPDLKEIPSLEEPHLSEFKSEYSRQLALQERYLNQMKPAEALMNMALYDQLGGRRLRRLVKSAHKEIREIYTEILENRYKNDDDIDNAKEKAEAEMKKLVVLHNPDMAAGGRVFSIMDPNIPIEDKIGWSSVNSSIGGQWPSRRNLLRQHLAEQSLNNCFSPQVKLRNCRSIPGQPGVPVYKQP